MNREARYQELLATLGEKGPMSAKDLSRELYISLSTIYRDLREMERRHLIIHGADGIVHFPNDNLYIPAPYKRNRNVAVKDAIAKKAAELIPPHATIQFDSSSTVSYMVEHIRGRTDLTVLTYSFFTAKLLANAGINTYFFGGELADNSQIIGGRISRLLMDQFEIDYMFFSPQSISSKGLIFDSVENSIRRTALSRARHSVCLCDKSKLGQTAFFHAASVHDLDYLITDAALPPDFPKPRYRTILVEV